MAIDASIYGNIKPLQVESPVNALAQVTQLKNAQNQNRLFDMQVADSERARADDEAVRAAYQLSDPIARSEALRTASPKAYREEQTFQSAQQKAQREAEKQRLEAGKVQMDLIGRVANSAKDQASYTAGLQLLEASGVDVSKIPQQFDPAYVAQAAQQAMSVKDQIDQVLAREKFGYQQRNDAANRGVQIRGQNLTDARGREANDINRQLVGQEKALKVEKLEEEKQARQMAKQASIAKAEDAIKLIDKAITHPGRETATGKSGILDPRNYSPGTDATNFQVVLDQLGGQAFLQAFESLKGGGQITEVEGKKATEAMARLNRKQSDAEFKRSLEDLKEVYQAGLKRAGVQPKSTNIDSLLDKYK